MAIEISRNREIASTLKSIIRVLEDGQKGMAEIGEHLKNPVLRRYFLSESLRRANFRGELENELHRRGVHDVHASGTVSGDIFRAWADLKTKLSSGDQALLETADQGENDARAVYDDALERDLPHPVRHLLAIQQAHILAAGDYIHTLRRASKAA